MNFNFDKHARICNLKINPFGWLFRVSFFLFITLFSVNVAVAAQVCSFTDACTIFASAGYDSQCKSGIEHPTIYTCSGAICEMTNHNAPSGGQTGGGNWVIPHTYYSACWTSNNIAPYHLEYDNSADHCVKCASNTKSCNAFNMYFGNISTTQNFISKYGYTFRKSEQSGSASWDSPADLVVPIDQIRPYFRSEYNVSNCKLTKNNYPYNHCANGTITVNNAKYHSYDTIIYQNASYTCNACETGWTSPSSQCNTCDTANHFVSYNNNCVCASGYEGTNCTTIKDHFVCNGNNCVCDTGYKLENGSDEDPGNDECVINTDAEYEDSTGQFNLGTNNCLDNWWEN